MTAYRRLTLCLDKIEFCGPKCPIYPCRYEVLSAKYENRCGWKMQPPAIRRKYINLLCGGEDELITEANNAVMTIDDGFKSVSAMEKIHRMRFGQKIKEELKVEEPVIVTLQKAWEECNANEHKGISEEHKGADVPADKKQRP